MGSQYIAKAKAIEQKNKALLLKKFPGLNDSSGIYFLTRIDESDGIKRIYVGQAKHILSRLAAHMVGYNQHIDLSLRKHGIYSIENPGGWRVSAKNFPLSQLDEKEKFYIKRSIEEGWYPYNVDLGGQGASRESGQLGARKSPRGYRDGLKQGYMNARRDVAKWFAKHLVYRPANDPPSRYQAAAMEKFKDFFECEEGEENPEDQEDEECNT